MTEPNEVLLPCPWCGDIPTADSCDCNVCGGHDKTPMHSVHCVNDKCEVCPTTGLMPTMAQAVKEWQTRATPKQADCLSQAKAETLREAGERLALIVKQNQATIKSLDAHDALSAWANAMADSEPPIARPG